MPLLYFEKSSKMMIIGKEMEIFIPTFFLGLTHHRNILINVKLVITLRFSFLTKSITIISNYIYLSIYRCRSRRFESMEEEQEILLPHRAWHFGPSTETNFPMKIYYFPHQFVSLVIDDQNVQKVSVQVSLLDLI